jgi:hypothetical protein
VCIVDALCADVCVCARARARARAFVRADNHATFMDLVLSGVVGIQPEPNGTLVVNPLVSPSSLAWWAADGISLHGKIVTVVFDADGTHYKAGAGLKVMVDGATAASSSTLRSLTVQL